MLDDRFQVLYNALVEYIHRILQVITKCFEIGTKDLINPITRPFVAMFRMYVNMKRGRVPLRKKTKSASPHLQDLLKKKEEE